MAKSKFSKEQISAVSAALGRIQNRAVDNLGEQQRYQKGSGTVPANLGYDYRKTAKPGGVTSSAMQELSRELAARNYNSPDFKSPKKTPSSYVKKSLVDELTDQRMKEDKILKQIKTMPKTVIAPTTAKDMVSKRVEISSKPKASEVIKDSLRNGQQSGNLARQISATMKSSGNASGKDPETLYQTSDLSRERRAAYVNAAMNDIDNPLMIAENTKLDPDISKYDANKIKRYTSMTDKEKARYNEIYGLYGRQQAEEYHDLILDEINKRIASEQLENDKDIQDPFSRTVYMAGSGFKSGLSGVKEAGEWAAGIERRKAKPVEDYVAEGIRTDKNNNTVENIAYDIAQSTGYMAPGMLLSGGLGIGGVAAKTAQLSGNMLFGLAQAGNTYRQDLNAGRDPGKAWMHAAQQGVDETVTNWLLGGINAFGGGALKKLIGNTAVGKSLTKGIDGIAKTASGKVILNRIANSLADMGGEAAQEYLQFYTENLTTNLLYGEKNSLNPLDPEAWYAAALGALNAGLLNLPGNMVKTTQGISADVSLAGKTAESLDMDPSHYKSADDFNKVQTLKSVAEEVAKKAESGKVSTADKIAYNEALADVLSSEANTAYNLEKINNSEQVQVRMLEVDERNAANTKKTLDEASEQWKKILTNPKLQTITSTDGTSTYDVERNGDELVFMHTVDGTLQDERIFSVNEIGKGGDSDILNVMPLQSNNPETPRLNTYVNYDKETRSSNNEYVETESERNVPESGIKVPETSIKSKENIISIPESEDFSGYVKNFSAALGSQKSIDNMINVWDGKNKDRYISAYKRVYSAGFNNVETAIAEQAITNSYLTKKQWQQAYKDGMIDGNEWRRQQSEKKFKKDESREGGITRGAETVSADQKKFLDWVGDKTGLAIEIREGLKGVAEINLEKGVLRINPYAEDFVGSISHELTHMIKEYAPKEYIVLQKLTVKALMKSKNVDYETLYSSYEQKYRSEVSQDYTFNDIIEEMVADGATAYMNDAEFAERVAKADRSLAKKIADFFKGIAETLKNIINEKGIRKVGRVIRENEAQFRIAANTWFDALEKAAGKYKEGYSVDTDSGDKFQIKEFEDGSKYVLVNTDQSQFDGLDGEALRQKVQEVINNKFSGTILGYKSDSPVVETKRGAKEYAYSKKRANYSDERIAKLRASTELDNLLDASVYMDSASFEDVKDRHPEAVGGFDYYKTVFTLDDKNFFTGIINVMKQKRVNTLYDVTKIKSIAQNGIRRTSYDARGRIRGRAFYTNNIPSLSSESNISYKPFYSPQNIQNVKELLDIAEGHKEASPAEIKAAKAKLILFSHNKDAAAKLGLTESEYNKKLMQWAWYSEDARKLSQELNDNVPAENRWSGIENMSMLKTAVSDEEFKNLVGNISGSATEKERSYIARVMLAADTHISYKGLNFEFTGNPNTEKKSVRGTYNGRNTIKVTPNSKETVAHEMGHYLDALWAADLTGNESPNGTFLSDNNTVDSVDIMLNGGIDAVDFTEHFASFIDKISDAADKSSNYKNDPKEVFARFFARFVGWTDVKANSFLLGDTDYGDYGNFKDSFTEEHFKEFVHILQEKSALDKKNKVKFQLNEPIEETRDLIAVRNVNQSNLASMLELEGLPSPSIAITKADMGHTQFGDVTFIFGRDTIDPEADRRNTVFMADAWTPTYDQLGVDTEIKSEKLSNIIDKFYAYSNQHTMFRDTLPDAENFGDKLRKHGGDLHEMADNSYDWKQLYLNDIGDPIEIKSETITTPYSRNASNDEIIKLADTEISDMVEQYMDMPMNQQTDFVRNNKDKIADIYREVTGRELFDQTVMTGAVNAKKLMRARDILMGVLNYVYEKPLSYVSTDYDGAKKAIDAKIDTADYHKWVDKNLKGVIGRKGIRNDKDMFTNSGKRRSFNQLHDPYTAENIVKALWKNSEQGVSSLGMAASDARSLRGAASGKFSNVDEMHARSHLLQSDTASNVDEAISEADSKLSEIYKSIAGRRTGSWSIGWEETYNEAMVKAATKARTAAKIKEYFSKEGIRITDSEASQLLSIFDKLRNLPTDYFEAKPKRVVDWNEIKLAVVPDNIDADIVDQLKDRGINRIEFYPAGDNAARLDAENKATDLRFQLDIDDAADRNDYANMVRESSTELNKAAEVLGQLLSSMNYVPSDKAIERTAKRLKKFTETNTNVEEIADQLKTMFNYIASNNKINGSDISDIAADYAGQLIMNSTKAENDYTEAAIYKRYKNAIKGYTFHMPAGYEGEVSALGGLGKLRREFFGTLNITKNKGISIDTMYDELADLYPDMFDRNRTNPADQLESIVDTFRALKPQPKVSWANEGDYDSFRYYAGQEIFKAYIAEGAADAGARSEYQKLRQKFRENEKTEKEMAMLQSKAAEMQARYIEELEESKKKVTKQTMKKRVEEARTSTKKKYYKDQIIKDTKELSKWLLKPTDTKHVPEQLKVPLANFLQNVDFSSKDLNVNGDPTQRTMLWMQLKDAWAKVADNGGVAEDGSGTQYIAFDPDIVAKMEDLTAKVKDMKRMEDLDYIGVLQLSDVIKSMKHAITNANELMSTEHYKTVAKAAESTLSHFANLKTRTDYADPVMGGFQKMLGSQMLDANTRFHTFGEAAEDVYKGLRKGFNKKVRRTAEAEQAFKKILADADVTSKEMNKWSSGDPENVISIKTERGTDLRLTVAQVMSLYELMKRNQARDHILTGGITSENVGMKTNAIKKIPAVKAFTKNKTGNVKVTKADVLQLIGKLTDKQKAVADGITAYFQTTAQWGNAASMQMYGYKKFNDPHYFPIKVDRNYLTTTQDQAAVNSNAVSIKNLGMTKSTIPHANNPLMLNDIFNVFTDQVNDMSNYEAFLVPLTDLQKWYNFKDSDPENKYNSSIKKEIERAFGAEANTFINKFIQNINGMKDGERYALKWLVSAFKRAAVGANLSVAIQQPTAYARAMAVIDPKYLMQALNTKAEAGSWEDIKKYSSIAQWKDWGFYETDIGRTMKNILTDPDTIMDKAKELQMMPAGKGDEIAWKRLWIAAELQVKDQKPDLKVGSDEFFKAAADIFDDVIDRTQVVDSVFHRVDMMRSTNDLTLMATAFMAEPMKSYNMMYRAVFDLQNAKDPELRKAAKVQLTRSSVAWILSNALAALAKSIITAMRDKGEDRDEAFWIRWMKHFWDEFKGNVEPWNYVPGIKDAVSIFQGYDAARTDMTGIQDLYYVMNRWKKFFNGDGKYTLVNNILYSTKAVSSLTGLALYGLQRDVNAVIDTVIEAFGADTANYEKQKLTGYDIGNKNSTGYYIGMAMKAYKNGNTGLGDKIISDMIDAGIEEDKISSKIKSTVKSDIKEDDALTSELDRIASGKDADLNAYKKELMKTNKIDEDMADSIVKSQIDQYMKDHNITNNAMMEALDEVTDYRYGYKDFNAIYEQWARLSQEKNGWDDKETRQRLRSNCTSYFKPLYQAGNATERSRILKILSFLKVNGQKVYSKEKDIIAWGK